MEVEAEVQKCKSYSGAQISGLIRDSPSEIKQKTVMKIKINGARGQRQNDGGLLLLLLPTIRPFSWTTNGSNKEKRICFKTLSDGGRRGGSRVGLIASSCSSKLVPVVFFVPFGLLIEKTVEFFKIRVILSC